MSVHTTPVTSEHTMGALRPLQTWFDGGQHSAGRLEHSLVDDALLGGELAVGRERARDVRGVARILGAHVKQAADGCATKGNENTFEPHVAVAYDLFVGLLGVSVVEDGAVVAAGADARVRHVTTAAVEVRVVQKHAARVISS